MTEDWDAEAAAYDDPPDHGLADPDVRAAWRDLLLGVLPAAPARVVDLGCGTGTLARLLVDAGHTVDGLDTSPEMLRRARAKVPEAIVRTVHDDVAVRPLPDARYWGREIDDERYLVVAR